MNKKLTAFIMSSIIGTLGIVDASSLTEEQEAKKPLVTAYYLGDSDTGSKWASLDRLQTLANEITEQGANFNKIIISFVQPSLFYYQTGSLAGTGLFGYYIDRNESSQQIAEAQNSESAKVDFQKLKAVIAQLEKSGVHVYLAVGGWNFSCDPTMYNQSLVALGKTVPAGKNMCGPAEGLYDTFPNPIPEHTAGTEFKNYKRGLFEDPATSDQADIAYYNLVKLTNDLGASGIDLDYEEFWHADLNSYSLSNLLNNKWKIKDYQQDGDLSYQDFQNLMKEMGISNQLKNNNGDVQGKIDIGNPGAMPETVDKFAAIIKVVHDDIQKINPDLKLSAALPAVGAVPTNVLTWSGKNHLEDGGPWYYGNLKGLVYNVAYKDETVAKYLDALSVMSYDLNKNDGQFLGGASDLSSQVAYYMSEYYHYLKSSDTSTKLSNQKIIPGTFNLHRPIQFGFEVGQPAYPVKETGNALPLDKTQMQNILRNEVNPSIKSSGMIMWDLYKDQRYDRDYMNHWDASWPTPKEVLQATCKAYNLDSDPLYNCNADLPSDNETDTSFEWNRDIQVTDISDNSATLAWTKPNVEEAVTYSVLVNGNEVAKDLTTEVYTLTNLDKATKYDITIKANVESFEPQSATTSFETTGEIAPDEISWPDKNAHVSDLTQTSAKVYSDSVASYSGDGTLKYQAKYCDSSSCSESTTSVTPEFVLVDLTPGETYKVSIAAFVEGQSTSVVETNTINFTTQSERPEQKLVWNIEPNAHNITENSVELGFKASRNDTDEISYQIIVGNNSYTTSANTYKLPNLTADTTYTATVKASTEDGTIIEKSVSFRTDKQDEPAPTGNEWDPNKVYHGGDKVVYNGTEYTAKWWTRGNNPANGGPWDKPKISGGEWESTVAYTGGDIVSYNGKKYKANWWTKGDNPEQNSAQYQVWTAL